MIYYTVFNGQDGEGKMRMIVEWIGKWKKLIAIIGPHPTVVTTYHQNCRREVARFLFFFAGFLLTSEKCT